MTTAPILFVSHGSPMLAMDQTWGPKLTAWGQALGKPRAIVIVSAHWLTRAPMVGAPTTQPLIYDFGGFPAPLYQLQYPAPVAGNLAPAIARDTGGTIDDSRGWDHGVWVPLLRMYPDGDVPILQVGLPLRSGPDGWLALGRALGNLSAQGVMVIGSGGWVHNLGRLAWDDPQAKPASWASDFDGWLANAMATGNLDQIARAVELAPGGRESHPSPDHFAPIAVAAAAAEAAGRSALTYPIDGWDLGNLSMRSAQWT